MSNLSNAAPIIVGALRTRLLYKSRDAMAANWEQVFPADILPDDHVPVPYQKVVSFLTELSSPKRGRSRAITGAAQGYLKEITGKPLELPEEKENGENPPIEQPEKLSPPSTKVQPETKHEAETLPTISALLSQFVQKLLRSAVEFLVNMTALDLVFLVGIGLADYSLVFFMKGIGVAWGTVYTLITLHALQMAKDRYSRQTAERGFWAVMILESVSFFLDLAMFNLNVWQAGKRGELPFSCYEHITWPFWVAFALATLFCCAVLYALSTTLALRTERTEAENWEANSNGLKW